MEQQIIYEQDVVNAVCVLIAKELRAMPDDVEVELAYDDDTGFSADAELNGKMHHLDTSRLVEALRLWIEQYLDQDPMAAGIQLKLDDEEGIIAVVR
ncbi:DUF2653 family protein [Sporosarcina sp. P17b]|uniref:DUF2653 family protein n=1 Tax=Sporosarcina sp. P17b TaxID=2048260 RepID=UPI000C163375|nr:DUF2653 family protein [Sporosarcina sp. P17b]PIC73606.1 hypothetical protein CSV76_09290 [Sporosarcina sp. P17b]